MLKEFIMISKYILFKDTFKNTSPLKGGVFLRLAKLFFREK